MSNSHNAAGVERLKADIQHEEEIKSTLEQSCQELQSTAVELEKRLKMIDEESNEWKTRFENQEEINRHLTRQIVLLDKNIQQAKEELKGAKTRALKVNPNEVGPEALLSVENEKKSLLSQLRDFEWRLEQENKAYHKANDERKLLTNEITDVRNAISVIKERSHAADYNKTDRSGHVSYREPIDNNPMDKRLDPKKGPISRNAAPRSLPRLDK
ncbi:unnamed protein product [Adineta steineri]|uniref:Uncharacterized protein n=1 Tax=Adineta steineri TaxID=433720 RepID=A0A815ABL3_9BILA|nr:unnamed protein product [Adineta steineri]CAF1254638.1 unnamed protein product [Adineta steineri]CAF1287201.1 unnamed protein product [Adineta steineri]